MQVSDDIAIQADVDSLEDDADVNEAKIKSLNDPAKNDHMKRAAGEP